MGNKQSYNLNIVFAKLKCITDFFSNNTGSSGNGITNCWMLILKTGVSGATVDAAALWACSSEGWVTLQAKGDV